MESLFGRYKNALVLMLVLLAQVVLLAMQGTMFACGDIW
jgi:hypothetical protein